MKESRKKSRIAIIIIVIVVIIALMEFLYMAVRNARNTVTDNTEETEEEVSGIFPENTDSAAVIAQARSLISQEDYEEAIEILSSALAKDEMNGQLYQEMSNAFYGLWEFDDMEEILLQGYEKTQDADLYVSWISCLVLVSDSLIEDEDYDEAVDWLIRLIDADGETSDRMYDLGTAYYMIEEYEEAVNVLEKADISDVNVKNLLTEAKICYGEECYSNNESDEAIIQFKETINIDPDSIEAYTLLIEVYIENELYTDAKTYIDQGMDRFVNSGAVSVDSDYLDAFLEISSSYYSEQEDIDGGLAFWQKVIELRPGNSLYQEELASYMSLSADEAFTRGEELLDAGDPTAAETYFRRAYAYSEENFESGIIEATDGIYCLASDGSLVTGWYVDEIGQKYYFYPIPGDEYALAVTGWQNIDNVEYYFDEDGIMLADDYAPDGRYVGSDGRVAIDPDLLDEEDDDHSEEDEDDFEEDESEEHTSGNVTSSDTGSQEDEDEGDNAPGIYIRHPVEEEDTGPGWS